MTCRTCGGFKELHHNLGVKQRLRGPLVDDELAVQLEAHLHQTKDYYHNVLHRDPKYVNVRNECKNHNPECTFWAVRGACQGRHKAYMDEQCPLSCQSCIELDDNHRCRFDDDEPTAWGPGDLNQMFTRIVTDPIYLRYKPEILSRPRVAPEDKEKVREGPWMVALDDFLTDQECETLIESGIGLGYRFSAQDVEFETLEDGSYSPVSLNSLMAS